MQSALAALLRALAATVLAISLAQPAFGQAQQPPEAKELSAAMAIQDPAAKLKELERIKAAYPASTLLSGLDTQITGLKVTLAATLDEVLALQKPDLAQAKGSAVIAGRATAARQILYHPKLASFDKPKVLAVVLAYRDEARKAAADPAVIAATEERLREYLPFMTGELEVLLARAQAGAGEPAKALATLDAFLKAGGSPNAPYFLTRADALEALNKPEEALEALVGASLENSRDGQRRAKEAYAKLKGGSEGFDALLDARRKELPFHPVPFKPGPAWKGRAVLAELFTGSECPPCVAADLAFDGLLESHPSSALVVLEYHLPIPGPDPMMNPATKKRQDYYGVNSTPTTILDGTDKSTGGGGRGMAGLKYKQVAAKVGALVDAAPGAALKLQAARKGDKVEASLDLGKALPGVDYQLVLVQGLQEHKAGNGLQAHKMVVRDLQTLEPAAKAAAFDLAASEQATDAYLTEFENTSTRFRNFKFPLRRNAIGREGLKVVLFAQERESKKVLQAVIVDVK